MRAAGRVLRSRLVSTAGVLGLTLLIAHGIAAQQAAPADPPADARIWLGRAKEFEDYLRTVAFVKVEDLSVGVTKPKKATLPPGGPIGFAAWKPLAPGQYEGSWESYKSEVAAYELDKMLGLDMVPPTVDKVVRGEHGAAVMWVSPTKSFKDLGGVPTPPAAVQAQWNRDMVRAKMFNALIENTDPNLGNWLVDPAWHLILIDHSRCFTTSKDLSQSQITRVDSELWQKFLSLTEASLKPIVGTMIDNGQIKALVQRRDALKLRVDQLVKEKGEAYVFMREGGR